VKFGSLGALPRKNTSSLSSFLWVSHPTHFATAWNAYIRTTVVSINIYRMLLAIKAMIE
jgi:hypothetical protein